MIGIDGTFIADDKKDVQTWIHIREENLVGLSLISEEWAEEEITAIIVSFILNYELNNDKVYTAFNSFFESGKETTVTSNGYTVTFSINDDRLYIDMTKEPDQTSVVKTSKELT